MSAAHPLAVTGTRVRGALLALLLVFLAVSWFATLDARKLTRSDEGRYAEIAREMAATGDWVTPRYNGVKYFEKPPLLYWATAAAYVLFGENEWTARLWVALTGFAGIVLIYWTGSALFGAAAGLLGTAVLAASPLWIFAGHFNSTDMGVAFFLEGALSFMLLGLRPGIPPPVARRFILAAWAAMALAVLSKGLIGIVLPGLATAAYLAVTRDFRLLARLHIAKGLGVFLALAAPWFILVSLRNPEFPAFFFIREHFGRYLTVEGFNRAEPWWYFIAVLGAGMLPWALALPAGLIKAMRVGREPPGAAFRPRLMLALWTLAILVFFSISRSKLPGYIAPAVPAAALLAALALHEMRGRALAWFMAAALALGLAALFAATQLAAFAPSELLRPAYARFGEMLAVGVATMATGGLVSIAWLRRSAAQAARRIGALLVLAGGVYAGTQIGIVGQDALRARMSAYDLAVEVNKVIDRSQPFYAVRTFDHTLPFYTRKTLTLVDHGDELEYGLQLEPGLRVRSIGELESRWAKERRPLALMKDEVFAILQQRGLAMRVVARDPINGRVVVQKP